MQQIDKTTEEKIFEAAQFVFVEKGLDGARMQEIADKAEINKSLLHYYYRSKEKLFTEVFKMVINKFLPNTVEIFQTEKTVFEKIEIFTFEYISLIQKNPFIPIFVLNELNKNPKNLTDTFSHLFENLKQNQISLFAQQIEIEVSKGILKPTEPVNLIVNIMSLCIFPFIAKPIFMTLFFNNDKIEYKNFIENRKTEVANFIINSIKI
jgi:AcrR family transcriptional regulator